jgi:hypothetical protein
MAAIMRKRGLEARPHGFRTSLKVWLSGTQQVSREVLETVISHQTGSRIEGAYNRTDYLEQRRPLMESWGEFLLLSKLDMIKHPPSAFKSPKRYSQ